MASSEGNYHRRGPYFDGTNFASWKHKLKMHILGHNPAVWAIVCVGLQGDCFDGKEPNCRIESRSRGGVIRLLDNIKNLPLDHAMFLAVSQLRSIQVSPY